MKITQGEVRRRSHSGLLTPVVVFLSRYIERVVLQSADHIITVSPSLKRAVIKLIKQSKKQDERVFIAL
jgi:hypothetical protein